MASSRTIRLAAIAVGVLGTAAVVPWRAVAQAAQGAQDEKILYTATVDGKNLGLYVMHADGTAQAPLFTASGFDFDPVWSPDHSHVAFSHVEENTSHAVIEVMDADGAHRRVLTEREPGISMSPTWSPDGKEIAYAAVSEPEKRSCPTGTICVMHADGSDAHNLAPGIRPLWSPDGSHIVFAQASSDERTPPLPDLYVMDRDGAHVRRLAAKAIPESWSADGTKLLCSGDVGGKFAGVVEMNADGSSPRTLLKLPDSHTLGARWSPDGKRILFTRYAGAQKGGEEEMNVYSMNADGTDLKRLTPMAEKSAGLLGTSGGLIFTLEVPELDAPAAK